MDKKKKFHNDPAKFFLYQDRLLTVEEREKAKEFSKQIIDLEKCPLCTSLYDLSLKAPRILVNCGHTLCTECLYMFFKDQKIKCPLCSKFVKRIRSIEILPLNHTIYHSLINILPTKLIEPINSTLRYPNEITEEIQQLDTVEYPLCEFHPDRVKHFMDVNIGGMYCRACIQEDPALEQIQMLDLYLLRPEHAKYVLWQYMTVRYETGNGNEEYRD